MKPIHEVCLPAIATVLALGCAAAIAKPSPAMQEDKAQLMSDEAALHRQIGKLGADEASLKADTASGRMSAESRDAFEVYQAKEAIRGAKKDLAVDKAASLQMKTDKAELRREVKRLKVAEATLAADARHGRTAAESKDAEQVYRDRQALGGEKAAIATDKKKLITDEKK
jgi:hypothetical protein